MRQQATRGGQGPFQVAPPRAARVARLTNHGNAGSKAPVCEQGGARTGRAKDGSGAAGAGAHPMRPPSLFRCACLGVRQEEGRQHQRLDGHELDEDVEGGARGVLERVAHGVADDGGLRGGWLQVGGWVV